MKNKNTVKTVVSLLLIAVLLFGVSVLTKSFFGVLEQKRDNPAYFSDCLSPSFDEEKSEAVTAELKTLTENALTYTAMKYDLTLFENYPYVQSEIDRIKKSIEREKADTLYFAAEQLKDGEVTKDMTENGFIRLSEAGTAGVPVSFEGKIYSASVDEERINGYYDEKLREKAEECKLGASTVYREAKAYLDRLKNVSYCVTVNGEAVSNQNLTPQQIAGFVSRPGEKSFLYIKSAQGEIASSEKAGKITELQSKAVADTAKKSGRTSEIYFEFTGSMLFHESLESVGALHEKCRTAVIKNIVLAAASAVISAALTVSAVILFPTGNSKKKSKTAVSCVLAVVFLSLTVISVGLFGDSVKLYLDPTLGTSWLTVDSGTIIMKACLRASFTAIGIIGAALSAKSAVKSRRQ